jgi:5'-phosphate synthase pdxT subunit
MFEPLQEKIAKGLPVLATCAGLILLAEQLSNDSAYYFCDFTGSG